MQFVVISNLAVARIEAALVEIAGLKKKKKKKKRREPKQLIT